MTGDPGTVAVMLHGGVAVLFVLGLMEWWAFLIWCGVETFHDWRARDPEED